MLVNLDELSAGDLLELAKKKQQKEEENARRTAMAGRLVQLRRKREQLLSDQERALAIVDKELQTLQQRRLQLVSSHQTVLNALEKEMAELSAGGSGPVESPVATGTAAPHPAQQPFAETRKTAAPAPTDTQTAVVAPVSDELEIAIVQMLRGRLDMSDSLMREQLRNKGFDLAKLGKTLEQLVREGKIMSKGSGNYALKKRL